VLLVIFTFAWFGFTRQGSNRPQQANNQTQPSSNQPAPQTAQLPVSSTSTPILAANWQTVTWHDPDNTVEGYKFDVPNSWTELNEPYGSERHLEVNDNNCPQSAGLDCVPNGIDIQVLARSYSPGNAPLPPGYSTSTIEIGGILADKIVEPLGTTTITQISFGKDNNTYDIQLFNSGTDSQKQANQSIFSHILSSFAFIAAQPPQAPVEYSLFKDLETWSLTYQVKVDPPLACSNGSTGNTSTPYSFQMSTQGDTKNQTTAGDIDTPYAKVISILQANGWQECKPIGATEEESTQGTSQVFIKNGKLIGIFRHYSNGIGNSLWLDIQYDTNS